MLDSVHSDFLCACFLLLSIGCCESVLAREAANLKNKGELDRVGQFWRGWLVSLKLDDPSAREAALGAAGAAYRHKGVTVGTDGACKSYEAIWVPLSYLRIAAYKPRVSLCNDPRPPAVQSSQPLD